MPSVAFGALSAAITETVDLRGVGAGISNLNPSSNRIRRSLSRGAIVLLSSHFERYIYAVNEEAVSFLNQNQVTAVMLADEIRLLHSKAPLDELAEMAWQNRGEKLQGFILSDGWLWNNSMAGELSHARILAWMKSPKPDSLVRYYRYWGIKDVFAAITRTPATRGRLRFGIQELVDKRNLVAHGDFNAVASASDIKRYEDSVRTFCQRADLQLARAIGRICGVPRPW
ncbi:HEPN domain-containing protein [Burkholderia ubonensis]|uniref:HEPN domain-containing protein n=1 Tax=Burkholderia ubonensis TaxID=101571 RepID=UPI000A9D46AD|nr:HEPN domain-containing protein [Burkholderia ubonensis]